MALLASPVRKNDNVVVITGRDRGKRGRVPELWDGHAAERIAAELASWLGAAPRYGTGARG